MDWQAIGGGAVFSLTAVLMVFLVLTVLALLIVVLKLILYRPTRHPEVEAAVPDESQVGSLEASGEQDAAKIAAIAAALAMHEQSQTSRVLPREPGGHSAGPWSPKPRQRMIQGTKTRRWSNG